MKRRPLILFLVIMTAFLTCVISVHAAQRQPSFFIPQKVLNRMNQPEKLPPIPQINYNEQQPQDVETPQPADSENDLERQRAAEAERLAQERRIEQKRMELERLRQEKQKAELERAQKAEAEKAAQNTATENNAPRVEPQTPPAPVETPKAEENRQIAENQPTVAESTSPTIAPQPVETAPEPKLQAMPLNNSQRTFDDIIADYKHDALGISQGKPVNNPRLRDILQDYSDERHIL